MNQVARRSADSRDSHLTLRRVERQQVLIELLSRSPRPVATPAIARELGVSPRTVERDIARLRDAGVPIEAVAGARGGNILPRAGEPRPLRLDFSEIAALIASLTALGPTATESAGSAMRALVRSIEP